MNSAIREDLANRLAEVRQEGLFKTELVMTTPQDAHVTVEAHGAMINLCANNYLGLASHPEIVAAAHEALDRWGFGTASVRFICGTQAIHRDLERRLSEFLGTEETILFSSCFDANGGLFETLLGDQDAVVSDALNHASIIDGIRLSKAARHRFANSDMDELEAQLRQTQGARYRLIATDGVFSMDGYVAKLDAICELAEQYDSLVMVDDSHAVGFVGPNGKGTPDLYGVGDRVDVITGTLGKAMGGASGGYVSGRREIIELLRQRSRPYLFSNSVAPHVVAATFKALDLIETSPDLRERLSTNTMWFRARMTELGFDILPGSHPIVPVMVGDATRAARLAAELHSRGVYAVSFSFPVVPRGQARIRTQISAAHSREDLARAATVFAEARDALDAA